MINNEELRGRAERYCDSRGIALNKQQMLGHGSDGAVWTTSRKSAVKAIYRLESYRCEVESYRRLKADKIAKIHLFHVPVLVDFDDTLMVIEMSIVQPPFLLDFGKVYIDSFPQDWSDSQYQRNRHTDGREKFGKRWDDVRRAMARLQGLGICNIDPRPSNVNFGDEDDDDDDIGYDSGWDESVGDDN
jgi:hypothetical protein